MSLKFLAFAASLLLAGAAMAQPAASSGAASPSQIQIEGAWARATAGKAENGAAYLTIVSPVPDRLTAVATPVAKKAAVHTMTMDNGVMKMRPLADVDLPANQPVTLKPGGAHIMLMGLNKPLKQGESFPLTLSFEKAGKHEVTVAVEKPGAMGPEAPSGAGMPMPSGH